MYPKKTLDFDAQGAVEFDLKSATFKVLKIANKTTKFLRSVRSQQKISSIFDDL
jgi:hypothetical protein